MFNNQSKPRLTDSEAMAALQSIRPDYLREAVARILWWEGVSRTNPMPLTWEAGKVFTLPDMITYPPREALVCELIKIGYSEDAAERRVT